MSPSRVARKWRPSGKDLHPRVEAAPMPRSKLPVPAREESKTVFGHLALRQGTEETEEFEG